MSEMFRFPPPNVELLIIDFFSLLLLLWSFSTSWILKPPVQLWVLLTAIALTDKGDDYPALGS